MIKKIKKINPKSYTSVSRLKVRVHDSMVRKRLNRYGCLVGLEEKASSL